MAILKMDKLFHEMQPSRNSLIYVEATYHFIYQFILSPYFIPDTRLNHLLDTSRKIHVSYYLL